MIALLACASQRPEAVPAASEVVSGIAVTVRLAGGVTAPGIFRGSREVASDRSGGTFEFDAGARDVVVLPRGAGWRPEADSTSQARYAIVVRRDDGSALPGIFAGPSRLAATRGDEWAAGRGVPESARTRATEMSEHEPRARVIAPGTAVRTAPLF